MRPFSFQEMPSCSSFIVPPLFQCSVLFWLDMRLQIELPSKMVWTYSVINAERMLLQCRYLP